jgi:hypothetical protein
MSRKVQYITRSLLVVGLFVVLLGVATTFIHASQPSKPVLAREDSFCVPVQVAVWVDEARLHVRCAEAVGGGILYFAMSTADAAGAARVLSLLTTAQVAGRTLLISYEPGDTSGGSFGCNPSDCRRIIAVSFGQ